MAIPDEGKRTENSKNHCVVGGVFRHHAAVGVLRTCCGALYGMGYKNPDFPYGYGAFGDHGGVLGACRMALWAHLLFVGVSAWHMV